MVFPALPKHYNDPVLAKISAQNLEKKAEKAFLGTFWKTLTKKLRFFSARALPSKLVCSGAKGALRKILGSVTKNGYLKIVQRALLGRQRSNP